MTPEMFVFYNGQLWEEYRHGELRELNEALILNGELFNGCYIYVRSRNTDRLYGPDRGWYRGDWTPFLEEQVPKDLRALLLLYT